MMLQPVVMFGSKLKAARLRSKKTLEEIAREVGVSIQALTKWEHHLARPELSRLPRISEVLNQPVGWFFLDGRSSSERILEARFDVGMKRADLATRIGVKVLEMKKLEEDETSTPTVDQLHKLGSALNKPWMWFLEGELDEELLETAERIQTRRREQLGELATQAASVNPALDEAIEALEATLAKLRSIRDAG